MRRDRGEYPPSRGPRGDIEARNRIVQDNMGLVYRVAREYVNRGLTYEDLVGEGNLGLIKAAEEFDPRRGTRFSTYAFYWIREAIQAALANTTSTIRVPMNVAKLIDRWRRTEKRLRQSQGHPPTFEEVAVSMKLDRPTQLLIARALRVARLEKETSGAEPRPWRTLPMIDQGDTPEQTLDALDEQETLSRRLERLDGIERTVVQLKFGLSGETPMTFEQIAGRLAMTVTRVQKANSMAIRKLGRSAESRSVPARHIYL